MIREERFLVQYGRFLPRLVRARCARVRALVRSSVRLCDKPESLCGRPGNLCARPRTCARVRAFCAAVPPLVRAELHLCPRQTTCAGVWHAFCRGQQGVKLRRPRRARGLHAGASNGDARDDKPDREAHCARAGRPDVASSRRSIASRPASRGSGRSTRPLT